MQNAIYSHTQPTDAEKLRLTRLEQEKINLIRHQAGRELELDQLTKRQANRKALEQTCSQSVAGLTYRSLSSESNINEKTQSLVQTTYKNPSKNVRMAPVRFCSIIEYYLFV